MRRPFDELEAVVRIRPRIGIDDPLCIQTAAGFRDVPYGPIWRTGDANGPGSDRRRATVTVSVDGTPRPGRFERMHDDWGDPEVDVTASNQRLVVRGLEAGTHIVAVESTLSLLDSNLAPLWSRTFHWEGHVEVVPPSVVSE